MKRILCFILSVAMFLSLLPSVSVTAAEETPSGITLLYNVADRMKDSSAAFSDFTYESNNCLWEYAANRRFYYSWEDELRINTSVVYKNGGSVNYTGTLEIKDGVLALKGGINPRMYGVTIGGANVPYVAMKFTADATGEYALSIRTPDPTVCSADMAVYLVDGTGITPANNTPVPKTFIASSGFK